MIFRARDLEFLGAVGFVDAIGGQVALFEGTGPINGFDA
jgi:hypothetical protein